MMTRMQLVRHIALTVPIALFVTGCASFSHTTPRAVVWQSYDLPGTLDANAVIRSVERSFARVLARPPQIIEGSVPASLPDAPAQVTVKDRRLRLDRLGTVAISEVVCPEGMAIIRALVTEESVSSVPRSVTGCVQVYAAGYRVSLAASRMVVDRREGIAGLMDSEPSSADADLLRRVGHVLREEIPGVRLVSDSRTPESIPPLGLADAKNSTDPESFSGERSASLATPPEPSKTTHAAYWEKEGISVLPLVCLAPRGVSVPVRAARGGGPVITTLDRDSIVAVAEPVDAAYFRVETKNGTVGWVNQAEVRRLPCPVG